MNKGQKLVKYLQEIGYIIEPDVAVKHAVAVIEFFKEDLEKNKSYAATTIIILGEAINHLQMFDENEELFGEIDDIEKYDLETDRFNDLKAEDRKDAIGYEDDEDDGDEEDDEE